MSQSNQQQQQSPKTGNLKGSGQQGDTDQQIGTTGANVGSKSPQNQAGKK